jgi:ABC-type polysaccharide/polyol phosphate transport system ATPase subunit
MPSTTHPEAAAAAAAPPAVELTDLGVRFRVPSDRITSFKEYVLRRAARQIRYADLWALRSIDLAIDRGKTFGIVGRNGSGKSTLLKVICRVLRPTTGRAVVRGSVAPLLELGAGFHPDLTGAENLLLNASILGVPRDLIEESFGEIVAFAELEDFIQAPIRTYSSGMQARLGFAVATFRRPDVLLLDEVLAVGDLGFQRKCLERIEAFRCQGTTVVIVSHSMGDIERCDRAAWLHQGRIEAVGRPSEVLPLFERSVLARE